MAKASTVVGGAKSDTSLVEVRNEHPIYTLSGRGESFDISRFVGVENASTDNLIEGYREEDEFDELPESVAHCTSYASAVAVLRLLGVDRINDFTSDEHGWKKTRPVAELDAEHLPKRTRQPSVMPPRIAWLSSDGYSYITAAEQEKEYEDYRRRSEERRAKRSMKREEFIAAARAKRQKDA